MKKYIHILLILIFISIILHYYLILKNEPSANYIFFSSEKELHQDKYSWYKLDPITILTLGENPLTIEFQIVIKYTYQDFLIEKDIIKKRIKIRKIIRNFFSKKTYNELNKAYKREILKHDIIMRINSVLIKNILGIYYVKFLIL